MMNAKVQPNKKEYKIILGLNDQKNEVTDIHITTFQDFNC
jgi:hypothetical protein